ncbi:MAG: hypothetical protein H0X24_13990 [Ktedonobacterales bacterium]|nr:hypothetical protein [Ktedonobacterales bacterium]
MYFTIRGRVDSFEDSSYERTVNEGTPEATTEMVARYQLMLDIPGVAEMVRCDLSPDRIPDLPALKVFDKWELEESWVVVTADNFRQTKGTKGNRTWAMASFSAVKVEEMSAAERQAILDARRQTKTARKQKAAAARAAKQPQGKKPDAA